MVTGLRDGMDYGSELGDIGLLIARLRLEIVIPSPTLVLNGIWRIQSSRYLSCYFNTPLARFVYPTVQLYGELPL